MKTPLVPLIGSLVIAAAGCGPRLTAVSDAPPTRRFDHATHYYVNDVIRLSKGAAIAFDCYDQQFFIQRCESPTVKSADPKIARIFPAHLDRGKDMDGRRWGAREGYVIAAASPGETVITLQTKKGHRRMTVIVE